MSEEVEKRVVAVLNNPRRSPFGNPIPALDELGVPAEELDAGIRVIDLPRNKDTRATIVQINEILQVDLPQFRELHQAGIFTGASVIVNNSPQGVTVSTAAGESVTLLDELAHAIRVRIDN